MNTNKIAILTDSGCDVPKDMLEKYDIRVLPLMINYSDGEYADGIDITPNEVCDRLKTEIPKTSLPSTDTILRTLDEIRTCGYTKVLVICISSGLSGTFNLIKMLCSDYAGLDSFVLDTKNISIGSGMLAIAAARYINSGFTWEKLCEIMPTVVTHSKVFFCVDTLEYLHKGGRIGLVSTILGNVLKLKPIISCNSDGIYCIVAKVRGTKSAIERMAHLALDFVRDCNEPLFAVLNTQAAQTAQTLCDVLKENVPHFNLIAQGDISPALIVHTGPGLIGVGIIKNI